MENFQEALEQFEEGCALYDAGEVREALRCFSQVAEYVTSTRARSEAPAGELSALATQVARRLAGYQNCDDEFAWERASAIHHDLFCLRKDPEA